jgi:hypothetical protein
MPHATRCRGDGGVAWVACVCELHRKASPVRCMARGSVSVSGAAPRRRCALTHTKTSPLEAEGARDRARVTRPKPPTCDVERVQTPNPKGLVHCNTYTKHTSRWQASVTRPNIGFHCPPLVLLDTVFRHSTAPQHRLAWVIVGWYGPGFAQTLTGPGRF